MHASSILSRKTQTSPEGGWIRKGSCATYQQITRAHLQTFVPPFSPTLSVKKLTLPCLCYNSFQHFRPCRRRPCCYPPLLPLLASFFASSLVLLESFALYSLLFRFSSSISVCCVSLRLLDLLCLWFVGSGLSHPSPGGSPTPLPVQNILPPTLLSSRFPSSLLCCWVVGGPPLTRLTVCRQRLRVGSGLSHPTSGRPCTPSTLQTIPLPTVPTLLYTLLFSSNPAPPPCCRAVDEPPSVGLGLTVGRQHLRFVGSSLSPPACSRPAPELRLSHFSSYCFPATLPSPPSLLVSRHVRNDPSLASTLPIELTP